MVHGYCIALRICTGLAGVSFSRTEEMSRRLRTSGARAAAIAARSYSLAKRALALLTYVRRYNKLEIYKANLLICKWC